MRNPNGTFKRIYIESWTPEHWDEGYTDNRGRFRVYRPDYPRCYSEGYALRYHVVWWLKTGEVHPKGYELHHIDGTKDNDRFDNLELLRNSVHQRKHKSMQLTCHFCKNQFYKAKHRMRYYHDFCSYKCYNQHRRS